MLFDRYSKTADELKKKSIQKHRKLMHEIDTYIKDYKAEVVYSKRMHELLKVRVKENRRLRREIEDDIAIVQTNDRRVTYEDKELDSAATVRKTLRFLYYFMLILWILLGDFFSKARYAYLTTWGFMAIYIAFPFAINKIIELIYYITGQVSYIIDNKGPKNVYTSL